MVYIRIVVVLGAAAGLFCRPVELSVDEVAKVAAIAIRDNGLAGDDKIAWFCQQFDTLRVAGATEATVTPSKGLLERGVNLSIECQRGS